MTKQQHGAKVGAVIGLLIFLLIGMVNGFTFGAFATITILHQLLGSFGPTVLMVTLIIMGGLIGVAVGLAVTLVIFALLGAIAASVV